MSWLRASRKVVDPAGVKWDIYITRITVADVGQLYDADDPPLRATPYGTDVFWLLGFVGTLASELVRLVIRLVLLLPIGVVRSRFGRTWRIEAISDWPQELIRTWRVEGKPGRVLLNEIARGLALGKVPTPAGTSYLGERER